MTPTNHLLLAVLLAPLVFLWNEPGTGRAHSGPVSVESEVSLRSDSARRWGRDGHKIVCDIAYREASTETRRMIDGLLALDESPSAFPESCVWADGIRGQEAYDKFRTAHYMNLPLGAVGVENSEHCAVTFCVLEGIEEQRRVLANPRYDRITRLDALKFLAHFIGDIHQPLHAGYDFDRGGNSTNAIVDGVQRNLHGVWDYTLIEMTGLDWPEYASLLADNITDADRIAWKSAGPLSWAEESYRIVVESVYNVPDDRVISSEYYEKNITIVEHRLKQAGVRMAAMLDAVVSELEKTRRTVDREAVSAVLDALHVAASEADFEGYFGLYTDDAVFLGTDATERWPIDEFKEYTRARFSGGTGWTYYMSERNISISEDGNTAWFDESLDNVNMGVTRGSGVLVKSGSEWKIAQYNLTVPIPNDLARGFVAKIREHTGVQQEN